MPALLLPQTNRFCKFLATCKNMRRGHSFTNITYMTGSVSLIANAIALSSPTCVCELPSSPIQYLIVSPQARSLPNIFGGSQFLRTYTSTFLFRWNLYSTGYILRARKSKEHIDYLGYGKIGPGQSAPVTSGPRIKFPPPKKNTLIGEYRQKVTWK